VRTSISRIQSEVAGLHSQLTNLQGSWSGQAATAFSGVVADWKVTQQRVEESLAAINQALGQAGQQYADIESANARLFVR
jgi:WXG100 family type VII secretion target